MDISSLSNMQMQNANLMRTAGSDESVDFERLMEEALQSGDTSDIRNAAQEMESHFINQMFQAMRRTVPEPQGIFAESNAQRIWQEMLDEETAKNLSRAGGMGIADAIYEQLTRVAVRFDD